MNLPKIDPWDSAVFKNMLLLQAQQNIALEPEYFPTTIVLNGYWTNVLAKMHEPIVYNGIEYGRILKTNIDRTELLLKSSNTHGTTTSVGGKAFIKGDKPLLRERIVGRLHTHPNDRALSTRDICLLQFPGWPFFNLVILPNRMIFMIMRTKETKILTGDITLYERIFDTRYIRYYDSLRRSIFASISIASELNMFLYKATLLPEADHIVFKRQILRRKS